MRALVACFFVAYLAVGLAIFGDYGIGWDELMHRQQGRRIYEYVTEENPRGVEHHMRYHGPVLDTTLYALEKHLGVSDLRDVYRMRHLVYFLVFYTGTVFFYLLARRLLESSALALGGVLFLVMTPRLFADSFYNPKDVPCVALFIVSMYTLTRYLEKPNEKRAAVHAAASALVLTLRLVGALVPLFTVVAIGRRLWREKATGALRSVAVYASVTTTLSILLWPTLWRDPVHHFLQALRSYGQYEGWPGSVLYMGESISSGELPWHYVPVWIAVTTPLSYLACFAVGLVQIARAPSEKWSLIAGWFFLPLGAIILLESVVYDTWRHTYFVYPALLLIALFGLKQLFAARRTALTVLTCLLIAVDLIGTFRFMVRNHPHQHLYFNTLVGGIRGADGRFDLDYWGVVYRKGLEHLAQTHPGETLRVSVAHAPGKYNTAFLSPEDRERIVLVDDPSDAEFYVTNFRFGDRSPFGEEVYSVNVDGVKVLTVFRRK